MHRLLLITLAAAAASAAPVIRPGGIYNAASFIPLGSAGSGLAEGGYFVIFGSGLGPTTIAVAGLPFPTNVGGTTVTVTPAGGSPVQAFLYYSLDGQVSGILPSSTATGAATLTVTYGGATSTAAKITVVKSNFGIFTMNQAGSGPGAILNLNSATDAPLNTLSNAAAPGQFMEFFGTGLGPITGADNAAPGAVSPQVDVKVLVGGLTLMPQYAGRAPDYPGLDQINFQIPSDASLPDGCFIPVAVQVNGIVSNYASFAKATTGRTCPAPLGLSTAALQKLDQRAKVNVGLMTLARSTIQGSLGPLSVNAITESAGATFAALDTSGLYSLIQTPGAMPPLNPPGSCLVQTQDAFSPPLTTIPPVPKVLDAGAKLTLSGPNAASQALPAIAGVGYGAYLAQSGASVLGIPIAGLVPGVPTVPAGTPATFLAPGQWSIAGAGGADVGAFTASVAVPTPLVCTSCDGLNTIDRSQPLTIAWTGGGGSQDYVQVAGVSLAPSLADPSKNLSVLFSCTARASDGKLTVPLSVLSQLPAVSIDINSGTFGALIVINTLGSANAAFTAPLTAGGNLDAGYAGYSSVLTRLVEYQ